MKPRVNSERKDPNTDCQTYLTQKRQNKRLVIIERVNGEQTGIKNLKTAQTESKKTR